MHKPYQIEGDTRPSHILVTCDHATNFVPSWINGGDLGIPKKDMQRHIAYDVGAAPVASLVAKALNAPFIMSQFSRLVIDPNRGNQDPTRIMKLYDGSIIEANRHVSPKNEARRMDELYLPYRKAAKSLFMQLNTAQITPILISIHSFTPQLKNGSPRPWDIGVLSADDRRLADPFLKKLRQEPDLTIGDNEPYNGRLPNDMVDFLTNRYHFPNILIEIKNDLIQDTVGQQYWGNRLTEIIQDTVLNTQFEICLK